MQTIESVEAFVIKKLKKLSKKFDWIIAVKLFIKKKITQKERSV